MNRLGLKLLLMSCSLVFLLTGTNFAYNGTDLLQALVGSGEQGISDTKVLYKGVLKNTKHYKLLQQAIDQGLIKNKNILIKLKSELDYTSLRTFSSLYAGIRLAPHGTLDEQTRNEVIELIRAHASTGSSIPASLPTSINDIKNQLSSLLERNNPRDQPQIQELINLLGDDPYATSYTGKESQEFDDMISGVFIGVGLGLQVQNGRIIVREVYEGPAKSAGIQVGDSIIRIDDLWVSTTTPLEQVTNALEGSLGSKVVLVVLRDGLVHEYTLRRKKIVIDPISITKLSDQASLVKISLFQTNTYTSFQSKLQDLSSQKTLVFDLRDNLGGSLDDTQLMLNHFIQPGLALYHIQNDSSTQTYLAQDVSPRIDPSTQLYFLTNHYTASASEIFAGVLDEYFPTSTIVGSTSYGKGTVQTVWSQDYGKIKFTTGNWLLGKSHRSINAQGLQPDVYVIDNPATPQDEVIDYVRRQL